MDIKITNLSTRAFDPCNDVEMKCECYQSLTAHQHQKGHTVPKQV